MGRLPRPVRPDADLPVDPARPADRTSEPLTSTPLAPKLHRTRTVAVARSRLGGRGVRRQAPGGWTARGRVAATAVVIGLLALTAGALAFGQSQSRDQLHDRFDLRTALGGRFVESYTADILGRQVDVASLELAGAEVSDADFERVVGSFGFEAAVLLDADGNALKAVPAMGEDARRGLGTRYAHLALAMSGTPAVSNVVASAAKGIPIIAFAAPFDTPHGRRVLSGGFDVADSPLKAYLENAMPFAAAAVYLVDARGFVVTNNGDGDADLTALSDSAPELAAGLARGASTFLQDGRDHRLAVQAIAGTPFRLVAAVPVTTLYAPISGPVQWTPWIIFAALVMGAGYLLRVLSSQARSQLQLLALTRELERSNRELRDFAAIASHDLQEPLRKIQAFGDRLAERAEGTLDPESSDYLLRMQRAAARMQALVQDLLEYSRVATRQAGLESIDLHRVLAGVVSDLDERVQSSGGRVEIGPLPTIVASPLHMRQLFQNLIANGLKFQRDGVAPVVRVEAVPALKGWEFRISDNGIGFEDRYAEQIFVPFQRLHGR